MAIINTLGQVATDSIPWHNQLPWLTLAAVAFPLVFAARKLKIYPTIWWSLILNQSRWPPA